MTRRLALIVSAPLAVFLLSGCGLGAALQKTKPHDDGQLTTRRGRREIDINAVIANEDASLPRRARRVIPFGYDKIRVGMTYEEVVKIMRVPGQKSKVYHQGERGVSYVWQNSEFMKIRVMFEKGRVTAKEVIDVPPAEQVRAERALNQE